jgi:hypothetical protein
VGFVERWGKIEGMDVDTLSLAKGLVTVVLGACGVYEGECGGELQLVAVRLTNAKRAFDEKVNILNRRSSPLFRCIEDLSREFRLLCGVYFWL